MDPAFRAEKASALIAPDSYGRVPRFVRDLIDLLDEREAESNGDREHDPAECELDEADDEPWNVPVHLSGAGGADDEAIDGTFIATRSSAPRLVKIWNDDGTLTEEWVNSDGARRFVQVACSLDRGRTAAGVGAR